VGNTYHNIVVKGPTRERIVTALTEQKHGGLLSATLDDLPFVYTPDAAWSAPAERLSRTFHCVALFAAVYDSDYFEYHLYDDGAWSIATMITPSPPTPMRSPTSTRRGPTTSRSHRGVPLTGTPAVSAPPSGWVPAQTRLRQSCTRAMRSTSGSGR
jgi:hypothetical protein